MLRVRVSRRDWLITVVHLARIVIDVIAIVVVDRLLPTVTDPTCEGRPRGPTPIVETGIVWVPPVITVPPVVVPPVVTVPIVVVPVIVPVVVDELAVVVSPIIPTVAIGNSIGAMIVGILRPILAVPLFAAAALAGSRGTIVVARSEGAIVIAGASRTVVIIATRTTGAIAGAEWAFVVARPSGAVVVIAAGTNGSDVVSGTELFTAAAFSGTRWAREVAGTELLFAAATSAGSVHLVAGEITGAGTAAWEWSWVFV